MTHIERIGGRIILGDASDVNLLRYVVRNAFAEYHGDKLPEHARAIVNAVDILAAEVVRLRSARPIGGEE